MTAPALPARRRAAAPLRGGAAIGAALLAGPSDHRAQPRVAVGRRSSCCTACSRRSSSASSATRSSSTTCRWRRPTRSARSSGGCSRPASSGSRSTAASRVDEITDVPRRAITTLERRASGDAARTFPTLAHIRVGRVTVEQRVEGSLTDMATIKRLYSDAVSVAGDVWESAQTEGKPGRHRRAHDDRRPRAGGRAEPHRAARADGAEELRQLHVHAHGERVDPDDGPGARARHRRPAAARVRPRRADARHRQGAHAARDPQQARQADRRRVRDHEAARRGRRRDPAEDARHPGARAGRRLRAPPAARRHRLPARRHAAVAQHRHDAVQHRRRLRRDALAARSTSRRFRPIASSPC